MATPVLPNVTSYATLAALEADSPSDGTMSVVYADPTPANNRSYVRQGGAWVTDYDPLAYALGNRFGFQQPGTGAVLQDFQAALQQIQVNVKQYGAKGDALSIATNASITSGTATLTCTGTSFASTDVGKAILVPGAGTSGAPLATTISAVTSSTQVTLAANASTTLTSSAQTIFYGTDDTVAVNAALTALSAFGGGALTLPPGCMCAVSSPISPPTNVSITGNGKGSGFIGVGTSQASVVYLYGTLQNTLYMFEIRGVAAQGIDLLSAQNFCVRNIYIQTGIYTNGLRTKASFAGEIANVWTNGSIIANACFLFGGDFNAVTCSNLYTSNFCSYNFLLDAGDNGGSGNAHGSTLNGLCAQGGNIGLWVRNCYSMAFNGYYSENVANSVQLGDFANSHLAYAITFNGGEFAGPNTSHPNYANRVAVVNVSNAVGVTFNSPNFSGAIDAATNAPVTILGGGGSGAVVVVRVGPSGAISSAEPLTPGTGFTSSPTLTVGGSGTGATLTASLSGSGLGPITITAGGSGYPTGNACGVVIQYTYARRVTVNSPYFNDGKNGTISPLYPWIVRSSSADPSSGIEVLSDTSQRGSQGYATSANLGKSQGYGYAHVLAEYTSSGALASYIYAPPQYP